MPTYEYKCDACGCRFEKFQSMSAAPIKKCPECGKLTLRRLISAPSFRLKGGGWYETDFKGGDKKRNLVETSSSESSESSKSADSATSDTSTKTDAATKETSKPAEKPAASEVKKPSKTRAARSTRT
jgi:putative FmdB family regulatory protein